MYRLTSLGLCAGLTLAVATLAAANEDVLIADFEGSTYGNWTAEGEAFGARPAPGALPEQYDIRGFQGKGLVNTFLGGDRSQGTLTSPELTIERKFINFLIGGGTHRDRTCIELIVDGETVRSTTGREGDELKWATWDVSKLQGKRARMRIVDKATDHWGHVIVDQIVQSDRGQAEASDDLPAQREAVRRLVPKLKELPFQEIVFTVRQNGKDGHWYANFSYWSDDPSKKLYSDHGKLCALNVKTGKVRVILDAPEGGVRDPQMHYDGKKILFSYRKDGQPYYHLYEINVDGTGLRQITDGPFDDIEPAYLPDGGIVFCSSRCNRMVQCYYVRVAIIHRCDADGKNIRALSANMEQDNTPWVLPDGRILYQRWEYIDRSQVRFHHLWTMNPDGTNQTVFFGNMHGDILMIDAKPIPGTKNVLASFSPEHGRPEHEGVVTIVDPSEGPDVRENAQTIVKNGMYRDPYPLSEDLFLAASMTEIVLISSEGAVLPIYTLPEVWRHNEMGIQEPRPIRARLREQVIPPRVDRKQPTGQVFLDNVYVGRNMTGVKPGDIKKLLVLEVLPKPVNFSGGQAPLTIGGTFTLERILGTVPVEEDGSANFELPALRSIFFVALDENDLSVKRMQSFMTVQPGESLGCVGCHEDRRHTPRSFRRTTTMARSPSKIEPIPDVPDVFDFPRDIQPILDRHCLACHDYQATEQGGPRAGGVILSGDRGPIYSHSYAYLTFHGQFSDGGNGDGNRPPRSIGSSASQLLKKLDGQHRDIEVDIQATEHEKKMVRLWIETAATYPGTYAALGSGMLDALETGLLNDDQRNAVFNRVAENRCNTCHDKLNLDPAITCNLTRPEMSLPLLKALAPAGGGLGMVKRVQKDGETVEETVYVFESTDDPDYQAMLAVICKAQEKLNRIKRFDMPGFRPNEHYIREMKLYGILPEQFGPDDPIDPYEIDRRYWKSHWYNETATNSQTRQSAKTRRKP
ncbi:MAG: PD40 domain-containing protein [Candidatus Nealsonbacteria bacterium]|nr:PD40 domain-containing protein [Candidatus Nealsonbacteria bacterium]